MDTPDRQSLDGANGIDHGIRPEFVLLDDTIPDRLSMSSGVFPEYDYTQAVIRHVDETDSLSVSSSNSSFLRRDYDSPAKKTPEKRTGLGTSIVRHTVLRGLSAQLISAKEKANAGTPTVVTMSNWIAVGTSRGLVLVFDSQQVLKWFLGSVPKGDESLNSANAVSALAINPECTRILVGFSKGDLHMYALNDGKLLRVLTDTHPPDTAVLHLKFTNLPSLALIGDSGGNVFEISFQRKLGVRSHVSRCIFSGSRGEVVTLEPLMTQGIPLSSATLRDNHVIVALATLSKLIVVRVRPQVKILFTYPLPGAACAPPMVAWQCVVVQVGEKRTMDPVLAFGRHYNLHFYQLGLDRDEKLHFVPLLHVTVNFRLQACGWLNSRTLALLEVEENRLHVWDVKLQQRLEEIDLTSCHLVTASEFFAGEATGGNVSEAMVAVGKNACYGSFVVHAGQVLVLGDVLNVLTLRKWSDRLDYLIQEKNYSQAFQLGLDFLENKSTVSLGLRGNVEEKKRAVGRKLVSMLQNLVQEILIMVEEIGLGLTPQLFPQILPLVVKFAVLLDQKDLLWDSLYTNMEGVHLSREVFLEALEEWILKDELSDLPPFVCQGLINHYEERADFKSLEKCVCHIQVASLNIHQLMKLGREHGLYDIIIYLHTQGLQDYVTPLEDLLRELNRKVDDVRLGNTLLVYISSCLAGRDYFGGFIPLERRGVVKQQILACLTCLHSKQASDDEKAYPYLRTLLQFNTVEFLNVLSIAFEDPEFAQNLGLRQKQRFVDILVNIMLESKDFNDSQIGSLFTFVARLMGASQGVEMDKPLLQRVLEGMLKPGDSTSITSKKEEKEQALLELLQGPAARFLDDEMYSTLISRSKEKGFFQVCELLFERRGDLRNILECYLQSAEHQQRIFNFLRKTNTEATKDLLENLILEHLKELMEISIFETGQLILEIDPSLALKALQALDNNPKQTYDLLETFLKDERFLGEGTKDFEREFVVLMADRHPERVLTYLKSQTNKEFSGLLEVCETRGLLDAQAYILECLGDLKKAWHLLLKHFSQLAERAVNQEKWPIPGAELAVEFCISHSPEWTVEERETAWLNLLDAVLAPQRDCTLQHDVRIGLEDLTQWILASSQGQVRLPVLLDKILKDPAIVSATLGQVRPLILAMLEAYRYESHSFEAATRLVRNDLHSQLRKLQIASRKGLSFRNSQCQLCLKDWIDGAKIVGYRCHHFFHEDCVTTEGCLLPCVLCNPGVLTFDQIRVIKGEENSDVKSEVIEDMKVMSVLEWKEGQKNPSPLKLIEQLEAESRNSSLGNAVLAHVDHDATLASILELRLEAPIPR